MPSRMPIVNMEIKSDLTKGLDEEEYLKRGKPTEENKVVETEASVESNVPIVKPKVKKPKTQKQLDALAKAREAKANKRKVKLSGDTPRPAVETEETEEEPVKQTSTDSYNPNLEKQHSGSGSSHFDYDRIINGVFSKMSAREEKRDAEARAKKEKETYEANIRKDERTRIMSEFEKRKAQQPPKRSLDPNQFLRPKTHGIDWDAAFRPR